MLLPATDSAACLLQIACFREDDGVRPAARCDAVKGVTQFGSLHPSISTLAPSGCESSFSSLCWTKTTLGELVAFCAGGQLWCVRLFFRREKLHYVYLALLLLCWPAWEPE